MSEIRFDDITPIEEKVYVGGVTYLLRETSGDASIRYENARMDRLTRNEEGKITGTRDLADLTPLLVSLCLFKEDGSSVGEATIRSWPSRVQEALVSRAREISGMNDTVESLEKQIAILQKQLTRVKEQEADAKNS